MLLGLQNTKYQIEDTFVITGRGLVLAGRILSGVVSIGDYIVFNFEGNSLKRKIKGIEGISAIKGRSNTGILVELQGNKEITALKDWKPNKVIAEILPNQ